MKKLDISKLDSKSIYNLCVEDTFTIQDLEDRKLYINDSIDAEVIESIVYHIMRYNAIDKDVPIEERKPIRLFLNTPGGSVVDGYGLIDAIITSKTSV